MSEQESTNIEPNDHNRKFLESRTGSVARKILARRLEVEVFRLYKDAQAKIGLPVNKMNAGHVRSKARAVANKILNFGSAKERVGYEPDDSAVTELKTDMKKRAAFILETILAECAAGRLKIRTDVEKAASGAAMK